MSTSQQLNKNTSSLGRSSVVAGEQAQPVSVQSQLASSTVQGGSVTSKSNLESIVADLGSAHNAHSGWLEAETQKITQWGNMEIARLMEQTKGVEQKLVAEAQLKQKALDESHKAELSRVVQELDAKKAMQLKELEDGLQRQIQSALNSSKADINNIESEMNKRKMALMQKAQEQTAKDVSRLTNLSVEAKLVPSTTRTVIETNTNTGTVVAVAGGGAISTGAAQASTIATEKVQAAPMAGTVTQGTDVIRGDIVRDADQRKVGDGVIVNMKTDVQQRTNQQPIQGAQPGSIQAQGRPVNAGVTIHEDPQQVPNMHSTSLPLKDTINTTSVAGSGLGQEKRIDASYGAQSRGTTGLGSAYDHYASTIPAGTIDGRPIGDQTLAGSKSLGGADPAYNKHGSTEGTHHKEGLLSKIKHAVTGEPRSNDAHNRL